jgi:integrase
LKYGPRIGELLALTWRDMDLDRGTLIIRRSKTGQGRTLRLSPGTVAALERHRKLLTRRGALRLPSAKVPVFPAELGDGHQMPTVVRRRLKRHLKEAGLPQIRFHDLRDTAATLMLEDGFPVHRVARILGHADPAMTLRRYAHVLSELEQEGAERLDRWAF